MDPVPDPQRLAERTAGWQGLPVLVLGDALLDDWRHGEPDRLCREAPVPVVRVERTRYAPGGAANTAVNVAALGGRPVLVTAVGDDEAGDWLRRRLPELGVEVRPIVVPGWRTPAKHRVVAGGQLVVRLDDSAHGSLPAPVVRGLRDLAEQALSAAPAAVMLCDYGYGVFGRDLRRWLADRRASLPLVAVDAHEPRRWAQLRPTLTTPSYAEAQELVGAPNGTGAGRADVVERRADQVLRGAGAELVAVTLDGDGAVVLARGAPPVRTRTRPVSASHAVGAGDAYLSALTLAVAAGAEPSDAALLAQAAAAAAIRGEPDTCVCDRAALLAELPAVPAAPADRVLDPDRLAARVAAERARGARVVFTNGCFDVLHRGHVAFLDQARSLGDLLVVAVNSDDSVRRLKGPDRPVNHVEDRTLMLAALTCVDHVVVFDEDSPAGLIERLRPDVYVKGGDYRPDLLPEADLVERLGGQVRILDYVPDRSTSAVIERIRSRAAGTRG